MHAFDLIQANFTLNYAYAVIDDAWWVSDGLKAEVMDWFQEGTPQGDDLGTRFQKVNNNQTALYPVSRQPVLINAPTGRGKNWFIIKVLARKAAIYGKRILILTNRSALTVQQRYAAAAEGLFPPYGPAVYEHCCIWGNIDIVNYQNAIRYLKDENQATKALIDMVVFDEAHFFCADAPFNSDTSYILQQLIKRFAHCKRIYMTATPEEVRPVIALEEMRGFLNYFMYKDRYVKFSPDIDPEDDPIQIFIKEISKTPPPSDKTPEPKQEEHTEKETAAETQSTKDQGNPVTSEMFQQSLKESPPLLVEYIFLPNFSYVRLFFYYDDNDIVDQIKHEQEDTEVNLDKWLIFVSEKEKGKELNKRIGENSFFVYSDLEGFGDEDEDRRVKKKYDRVVEEKYFEEKVMISTTVFYNGISLEDPGLKNIVVDTLDRIEMIQMLGRKRCAPDETVNLYIQIPTINSINKRIKAVKKRYNATLSY